jgi:hypothetical protein
MQPQLVPVITQAWSGDGHAPSHCGTSALPQDTLRHAHEPVPTAARQLEPAPHDPVHCPFSKRQAVLPTVVVVVELPRKVLPWRWGRLRHLRPEGFGFTTPYFGSS